jgi:hypothetical protein
MANVTADNSDEYYESEESEDDHNNDETHHENDFNYEDWDEEANNIATMLAKAHEERTGFMARVEIMLHDEEKEGDSVATSTTTVHINLFDVHALATRLMSNLHAISNNGAQCCILGGLGDTWKIQTVDPFRRLNIIGAVPPK